MGLVNFYHRFLPHGAELMHPLHELLPNRKSTSATLNWSEDAIAAFNATNDALANATLLSYPRPDAPTSVMTDASDLAVGAVLQQYSNGTWHPISFFSKKMKPAETRYSTFDGELLAIYLAIRHFRHFLEGRHFHVWTDHKPLTHALHTRLDRHSPRQARRLDYISVHLSHSSHSRITERCGRCSLTPRDECSTFRTTSYSGQCSHGSSTSNRYADSSIAIFSSISISC